MKNVETLNMKKICNFYVSDIHLSVMLLQYMKQQINEDVEIATIFEDFNTKKYLNLIDNTEVGEKSVNINWLKNISELNEIELNNKKKVIFIVNGCKDYISKENQKIFEYLNKKSYLNKEIVLINCYNVEEVCNEMKKIVMSYDSILNTSGIYNK